VMGCRKSLLNKGLRKLSNGFNHLGLTVRWLGHPPQNSSTTIALSERKGLAAFAEAPTCNAERHLPSLSAEPVAFRFPYCVKPEL